MSDALPTKVLKKLLSQDVKDRVEGGLRAATTATARLRPGPDFVVVGTKRGGTTTLWQALEKHPHVMPMVPAAKNLKSPHWFTIEVARPVEWYLGHFPTAAARKLHARRHGGAVSGESSPLYLYDPRVPALMAEHFKDTKIIVSLRNPVDRAMSHWKERRKEGVESLSFPEALAAESERTAGELEKMLADPMYYSKPFDYFTYRARGEYADQVARWFDAMGRDQVHVMRSEDMYSDQATEMSRLYAFLGLPDYVDTDGTWRNKTPIVEMPDEVRAELTAHFEPHNQRLAELLGTDVWW